MRSLGLCDALWLVNGQCHRAVQTHSSGGQRDDFEWMSKKLQGVVYKKYSA